MNAIEKLEMKIKEKNSRICAGLDPVWDYIPKKYYNCREKTLFTKREILLKFSEDYISTVADYVPAIKINSAFFEIYGLFSEYIQLARLASDKGLVVIGDLKRGDIGSTSNEYARAYLYDGSPFDFITIQSYFGTDGIQPFVKVATKNKKAVFCLVKTSNKSSAEIQDLTLENGKKVYEQIADLVSFLGNYTKLSENGYNSIGAVVGATYPEEAKKLRECMPKTLFLVPGYGAQGAKAKDVAVNFDSKGFGAIVNSSRALMCAYKNPIYEKYGELKWMKATKEELKKSIHEINEAIFKR